MPDLPQACWNLIALEQIASTASEGGGSSRRIIVLRYGRVAIVVDTAEPLVPGTEVELESVDMSPFWQIF